VKIQGIYLDYNATTPVAPEVRAAMEPFFSDNFGNPSSVHRTGQRAQGPVTAAREKIAALLNADGPDEIVFTGGGSEADNLAIKGVAWANRDRGRHIITSAIEHPAVLATCEWLAQEGYDVTFLPVDEGGFVSPAALAAAFRSDTVLVTIMHANNEVGSIEPVEELAALARERGVLFHTDAVQTAGKIPLDVKALGCDLLSISAHKFYGPKGIGALYVRRGIELIPVITGGHQESGRRAGTHNTPGIIGMAAALEMAASSCVEEGRRQARLRDRLRDGVLALDSKAVVMTPSSQAMPNTLSVCFAGVDGEAVMLGLDIAGISVSTGSACASASTAPSHVHLAMGCPPEVARGSIRFSLGKYTTEADIDATLAALRPLISRLRALAPDVGAGCSR